SAEALGALSGKTSNDQNQGPRHALFKIRQRRRNRSSSIGIVPTIQPELAANRRKLHKPALCQSLHSRRPVSLDHSDVICSRRYCELWGRAKGSDCKTGILEL